MRGQLDKFLCQMKNFNHCLLAATLNHCLLAATLIKAEPTGTLPGGRRPRPLTTNEQHISNTDPPAEAGDLLHPGQE
jgi:hypothetical protein